MHPDKDSKTTLAFIDALVSSEPALRAALETHLAFYGELLPHVLMADVAQWLITHGPQPQVLAVLDDALGAAPGYPKSLIYFSFLEPLDPGEAQDDRIIAGFPPRLRAALAMFHAERR